VTYAKVGSMYRTTPSCRLVVAAIAACSLLALSSCGGSSSAPLQLSARKAPWRDPDRLQDWMGGLSKSAPVVVYCAYGFHVGCKTAVALREAGFDARYMKGGHSAWKATGGPVRTYAETA